MGGGRKFQACIFREAQKEMNFLVERKGDFLVIIYNSEFIADDTSEIKRSVYDNFDVKEVILDISGVKLVSTPSLGALLSIHKHCIQYDKKLTLVGLSPYIKEIFALTKLVRVFNIKESVEEVLNEAKNESIDSESKKS